MSESRAAVFLDRDGVINALVPDHGTGIPESPYRADDVDLLPEVGPALDQLAGAGLVVVVVSNQPAAAKGLATKAVLDAVHQRVVALLGTHADTISQWRYCCHHPEAANPALRKCDCRKPKPGLLLDAAADLDLDLTQSWIVGDADRDIAAGAAVGCRTLLIDYPGSEDRRQGSTEPDLNAPDLPTAALAILAYSG